MTAAAPRRRAVRRLAPEAERVWGALRSSLDGQEEFRLALVFGVGRAELAEFGARCTDLARGREARVDVLTVPGPDAPDDVVDELCRPRARLFATWLDATDPDTVVPFLQRLDPRHERVVAARPATLVVAAPAGMREVVVALAPGLWSRRSLSVDLRGRGGQAEAPGPDAPNTVVISDRSQTVDLTVRAEHAAAPRPDVPRVVPGEAAAPAPAVAAALRRAAVAVERGARGEALAAARDALAAASRPEDRGPAHGWLALALDLNEPGPPAEPDAPEEEDKAHEQAVLPFATGVAPGPELTDALLALLHDLAYPLVSPAAAHFVVGRRLARLAADGPAAQPDLSTALDWLDHLDDAHPAAAELLGVARRFRATLGDTPRTLEDLADALDRFTRWHSNEGRLDDARATAAESLDARRRLRALVGDTGSTLGPLLVGLEQITALHRADGRLDEALSTAGELVDVARRHREVTGETSIKYTGLARSLRLLGDVQREAGHLDDALVTATEFVDLHRRHCGPDGRHSAPWRVAEALDRLVALQHETGRLDDALTTASEALDLERRVHARVLDVVPFEDHPEAARPVVAALERVADLLCEAGRPDEAVPSAAEALDLCRRLHSALGEPPEELEGLSAAIDRLGGLLLDRGELRAARPLLVEALELDRSRRERSGPTATVLQDLRVSLVRVAELEEADGDRALALARYREALEVDHVLRDEFGPPHWTGDADLLAAVGRLTG